MYLAIKVMSSMADDVIIVTSSLTKDMTGKVTPTTEVCSDGMCITGRRKCTGRHPSGHCVL